jgi:hypothetical protein
MVGLLRWRRPTGGLIHSESACQPGHTVDGSGPLAGVLPLAVRFLCDALRFEPHPERPPDLFGDRRTVSSLNLGDPVRQIRINSDCQAALFARIGHDATIVLQECMSVEDDIIQDMGFGWNDGGTSAAANFQAARFLASEDSRCTRIGYSGRTRRNPSESRCRSHWKRIGRMAE